MSAQQLFSILCLSLHPPKNEAVFVFTVFSVFLTHLLSLPLSLHLLSLHLLSTVCSLMSRCARSWLYGFVEQRKNTNGIACNCPEEIDVWEAGNQQTLADAAVGETVILLHPPLHPCRNAY